MSCNKDWRKCRKCGKGKRIDRFRKVVENGYQNRYYCLDEKDCEYRRKLKAAGVEPGRMVISIVPRINAIARRLENEASGV